MVVNAANVTDYKHRLFILKTELLFFCAKEKIYGTLEIMLDSNMPFLNDST